MNGGDLDPRPARMTRSAAWPARRMSRRRMLGSAAALAATAGVAPWRAVDAAPPAPTATIVRSLFDPALGHNIVDLSVRVGGARATAGFLDFYLRTGGLERWGHAISEPLVEHEVLCQYFQRGVLEWAPVGRRHVVVRRLAWDFLGGGVEGADDLGFEPGSTNSHPGLALGPFGHVVSNVAVDGTPTGFLDVFVRLGGVESFGFPKTEARADTGDPGTLSSEGAAPGLIRQYFQAAVMELHPGEPAVVLLRLLGDELRDRAYPADMWTLIRSFNPSDRLAPGAGMELEFTQRRSGLLAVGAPTPPSGFRIGEFADTADLGFPSALAAGPDGRLYVCFTNDAIVTLTDTTADGRADQIKVFAEGANVPEPRGVAFAGDAVYASVRRKIIRLRDTSGTGHADESADIITGLVAAEHIWHRNNGIAIGPDGRLYVAMGSTSNAGELPENEWSGSILRASLDGEGLERFATGLRNPYDLAFGPGGDLFCTDNGPDFGAPRADDLPDELNHIVEGADYGHPTVWGEPPPGSTVRGPVAPFPAHSAVTGMTFFTGPQAGAFEGDILVTTWGPGSGRSSYAHNVLRVELTPEAGTFRGTLTPFVTGLIRPTDVAVGPRGDLFISDHVGRKIYRVWRA